MKLCDIFKILRSEKSRHPNSHIHVHQLKVNTMFQNIYTYWYMMIKRVTSLILKFLFSTVAMTPCFFSNICNHILYSFLNREKTSFLASLFKYGDGITLPILTYVNIRLDKIKYVYTYYYFITSYIEKGEPSILRPKFWYNW